MLLKRSFVALLTVLTLSANVCFGVDEPAPQNPDQSLQRLIRGNKRYVDNKLLHPNRTQESREAVVETQKPFAAILGCSDSRVSPEIVFDQGIGDLFVVRVAGNVAGPVEIDSLEYTTLVLGSSLVLVMGHQNCGAVNAVLENKAQDIESVASLIEPALADLKDTSGDRLEKAVKANVKLVVETVKKSPIIGNLIQQGKVKVIGAYYHLENGEVEILK